MESRTSKKIRFNQGSNFFRQRLTLSLLSSQPVKLEDIRSKSELSIGLSPFEVSFINLLDQISNGSKFKINETGTEVSLLTPGSLIGGEIHHSCDPSRSLSYYLEPILLLAPFCKNPLNLVLTGRLQNDLQGYNSLYKIKYAALPLLEYFGLEPDIQIVSRSYDSSVIKFTCNVKKQLLTLRTQLNEDCGKVKKIRGLAYGFRVAPQMLNRIVAVAKAVFSPYLSDVYITIDPVKGGNKIGKQSLNNSPGYGLCLYAQTTKNICYSNDGFVGKDNKEDGGPEEISSKLMPNNKRKLFDDEDDNEDEKDEFDEKNSSSFRKIHKLDVNFSNPSLQRLSPEDLGSRVGKLLLSEMLKKSTVDSAFQWLVLSLMALSPKDISSLILGSLTPFTVQYLRDLKTFFGVTFKVENLIEGHGEDSIRHENLFRLSCLGTGFINLNKPTI